VVFPLDLDPPFSNAGIFARTNPSSLFNRDRVAPLTLAPLCNPPYPTFFFFMMLFLYRFRASFAILCFNILHPSSRRMVAPSLDMGIDVRKDTLVYPVLSSPHHLFVERFQHFELFNFPSFPAPFQRPLTQIGLSPFPRYSVACVHGLSTLPPPPTLYCRHCLAANNYSATKPLPTLSRMHHL